MAWRRVTEVRRRVGLTLAGALVPLLAALACNGEAVAPPVVFLAGDSSIAPCEGAYCDTLALQIYEMNPFYRKIIVTNNIPVVSSEKVRDPALEVAAEIKDSMIAGQPLIWAFLVEAEAFVAVIAESEGTTTIPEHAFLKDDPDVDWDARARGVGGTPQVPVTSVGEENLLCLAGDRYAGESILVHEFAHTLHLVGIDFVDPAFDGELRAAFEAAKDAGLWSGTYAGTDYKEYWAEGVQSWFDANRENQPGVHNHVNTREELRAYDPALAELIARWLPETSWSPRCPSG